MDGRDIVRITPVDPRDSEETPDMFAAVDPLPVFEHVAVQGEESPCYICGRLSTEFAQWPGGDFSMFLHFDCWRSYGGGRESLKR